MPVGPRSDEIELVHIFSKDTIGTTLISRARGNIMVLVYFPEGYEYRVALVQL